ncbi:Glutamate decarboxylase [Meyerozyma sp. JA9]|nr:Glutamate decarboxylase [Meyerozyma sp. JA9]
MTLSKHFDVEEITHRFLNKTPKTHISKDQHFLSAYDSNQVIPKYSIPENSTDADLVYKYLSEELTLDGTPTLNLASFVTTSITDTPKRLAVENLTKNLADNDEYPSLIEFQNRCISILSNLWHAPTTPHPETGVSVPTTIGAATTGSSEAIMLGGLALKKSWQLRQKAAGKSTENPNIIMASCAQVALEKFARYFDVEDRIVPISKESHHVIDVSKIKENIDENTIGIFVILGSTFNGAFEPVEEISKLLDEVEKEKGLDIKIHVDGASGAFVAPFLFPNLKWDFAVDRVVSINTSGHKFGLTSAGLGWVIWRDAKQLPENLRFKLDYLGGVEETFGLNFSRPGFQVVHQYYNLLHLGRDGYTKIFESCQQNARLLANVLEKSNYYDVVSVIHKRADSKRQQELYTLKGTHSKNEDYEPGLPVIAFKLKDEIREKYPELPQSIISLLLRNKGFIVPNYHFPANEQNVEILRVVVKESLSLNLLDKLMTDIIDSTELLLNACTTAREIVKHHGSEKEQHALIYEILLSIASGGVEEVKAAQHAAYDKEGTGHRKHKKSYRGAC